MPGVESRGKKIKSGALCTLEHEFLQRLVFPALTQVIDKTLQLTFISEAKVAVFVERVFSVSKFSEKTHFFWIDRCWFQVEQEDGSKLLS